MCRFLLLAYVLPSVGVATAADPDPKSLAVPPEVAARVATLVADLGHREFAVREAASRDLRKLGRLALPALRQARATDSNPEVRQRVEALLPAATTDDLRARMECLLADVDGKYRHDLPGVAALFKATGRSAAAKALYRELFESDNRGLLLALDGPEADLRRVYTARRNAIGLQASTAAAQKAATATAGDVAVLLLAESRLPEPTARTAIATRKTTVLANAAAQTALRPRGAADARTDVLGDIVRSWAESRTHPVLLDVAVRYFRHAGLPHGLPVARRLAVADVWQGSTSFQGEAIAYLARFGGADELALLETLFDDERVVDQRTEGVGNKRKVIQFRDLALTMAVLMTKQDLAEYGLSYRYPTTRLVTDDQRYSYFAHSFEGDTGATATAKRAAAFEKYAEWKAKQKKGRK
jgi:hypothetical protein